MAVQHHLDQPLMQINEIDISPGFETQVTQVLHSESLYISHLVRSPCRPPCTQPPRRPRRGSPQRRGAATLTERSCSNTFPMACTGQDRGVSHDDDDDAPGMTSGTVCSRRLMTRCWTNAAAPPTTTGAWWTCPLSSKRDHSAK